MKLVPLLFLNLGILQFVVASNRIPSDEVKTSFQELKDELENIKDNINDYKKKKGLQPVIKLETGGKKALQLTNISNDTRNNLNRDNYEERISTHEDDSHEYYSSSNMEITESRGLVYNFRFSYALSFPTDTDFREYQMEYEWGHHLEAKFYRKWENFFLGFSLGSKIFENEGMTMPYAPGRLEIPASGSNYSVFSSITAGIEHFLNNNIFITSSVGLGVGIAMG